MKRFGWRGLRNFLIAALVLGAATVAYLRTPRAADDACTLARRHLPNLLGLDVGIGSCALDPLTQTVRFRGLSLFAPGAETPLIAADEAEVSLGAVSPFFGSVQLDRIRITRPRVTLDLTGPRGERAPGECRLDALDRVDIGKLEIRDAEVSLALPGGRAVEVSGGEVAWRKRRGRAEIHVTAATGRFVPRPGAELELTALSLDARFDPGDERLEITRAEIALDGIGVEGSGDLERLCDPEVKLEANAFVPLATLARALEVKAPMTGHLWARVNVEGPLSQPAISGEVAGSDLTIGRYAPGAFDARVSLQGQELRIDSFETAAGAGVIRARGTLGLTARLPLAVDAEIDRAEFGPVLAKGGLRGSWVDFPATGRARIAGNLWPSPALEGDAALKIGSFMLASRAYDAPHLGGKTLLQFAGAEVSTVVRVLPDRVELVGVRAQGKSTRIAADATLHYAPDRGVVIRGQGEHVDFSEFGHLAGLRWAGNGSAQFQIIGPYGDPRIDAAVNLRDFEFWRFSLGVLQGRLVYEDRVLSFPAANGQKGRTQYHGSGELRFAKKGPQAKASLRIPAGRTEDLVDALMPMHENVEIFQGVLQGDVAGSVEVDSPVDAFDGTVALDLSNTRYYGRRLGDGRAVLRFVDGESMILGKTVLRGALGVMQVEGTWHFDGPLDYRFRIDRGSLAEVIGPAKAEKLGLTGELALFGKVGGDTTSWTVAAYLTSPSVTFAGKKLGGTHLEGRIQGRDLQIWGKPFEGARTTLKLKIKEPYPWEVSAHLALPEIRPLLPQGAISQGVSGAISATVDASGDLRDSKALEGVATVDRLTLTRGDFSGANDGRIELSWKDGALRIENFKFRGPNTALSVAGSAGPAGVDVDLLGSFDMRLLESFVPQIERSGGKVEITAAAAGTWEAPTLAGTASLQDGRLAIRDQPLAVRALSGRVEFSETRLLIQDVHGALNDGRVAIDGDLRLERFSPKFLQLRMQLDRVNVRPNDDLSFVTDGELLLAGKPDALVLSGDLDLPELLYRRPLTLDALLTDIRSARVRIAAPDTPKKDWITFDVAVHANGNVRVENNLAKGRLRGDLRLTGTNARPGLLGTIEAHEGSQILFRGNTFAVSQALVEFKERREIDPVFDLHAQTSVREYLVSLHAFGRVRDPQVILSADPDLAEGDILSLLTIGVTSHDKSDTMSTAGAVAGEAIFNATGLDKQVQRFLPKNPLLRDLSFHMSSTYNESTGTVVPTAQLESKFLTERLKLGMSQPVGAGRGTRASAEYRFDDRLSTQFQWDNDRDEELPNFGVDLKLRWEME